MHHSEQPALPRIGDVRLRGEDAAGRHVDISRLADEAVDEIGNVRVIDERVDELDDRHLAVRIEFVLTRAEPRASQDVLDRWMDVNKDGEPDVSPDLCYLNATGPSAWPTSMRSIGIARRRRPFSMSKHTLLAMR